MNAAAYGTGMLRVASLLSGLRLQTCTQGNGEAAHPQDPQAPGHQGLASTHLHDLAPLVISGSCIRKASSTVPEGSQHNVKRSDRAAPRERCDPVAGSRPRASGARCGQLVTVMGAMICSPWAETTVTVVVAGAVVGFGPVPT